MNNDPIVAEIRRVRNELLSKCNDDLGTLFRYLKERERTSGKRYVSYPPRRYSSADLPVVTPTE